MTEDCGNEKPDYGNKNAMNEIKNVYIMNREKNQQRLKMKI